MRVLRIVALMVVWALVVSSSARAADDVPAEKLRLQVELRDGSVIIGTTGLTELPIEHATLGVVKVKLTKVRGFEIDGKTGRAEFWMRPDNEVQGKLGLDVIPMTTLLGKVNVPVQHVQVVEIFNPASLRMGLVGHYALDGNAKDKSGKGNDGTVHGAVGVENRFGQAKSALRFDGKDDFVDIGAKGSLQMRKGFTVAAWVKFEQWPMESGVFASANPGAKDGRRLSLASSGFEVARSADEGASVVMKEPLAFGRWYHVAALWNGHEAALFVNGEEVAEEECEGRLLIATANWIGKTHESRGYMKGAIDDVRIYNRGLDWIEIREIYKMERPEGHGEEEDDDDDDDE